MTSSSSISALLPMLKTLEKPIFWASAVSKTPVMRAPDWEMRPMDPGSGMAPKLALSLADVLATPRQLGPRKRTPAARARPTVCSSSAKPAGPVSLKPAEMTTAAWVPLSPRAPIASGTSGAGRTITARSGALGSEAMSG